MKIIVFISMTCVSLFVSSSLQSVNINGEDLDPIKKPLIRLENKTPKTHMALKVTSVKDTDQVKAEWLPFVGIDKFGTDEVKVPEAPKGVMIPGIEEDIFPGSEEEEKFTLFSLEEENEGQNVKRGQKEKKGYSCYPICKMDANSILDGKGEEIEFEPESLCFQSQCISNVRRKQPITFKFKAPFSMTEMRVFPHNADMYVVLHGYMAVIDGLPDFNIQVFNASSVEFVTKLTKRKDSLDEGDLTQINVAEALKGMSSESPIDELLGTSLDPVPGSSGYRNTYVPRNGAKGLSDLLRERSRSAPQVKEKGIMDDKKK
jgi:hypothetical protein